MPGISIGSCSVSVVPSAVGFTDKLRAQLLPESDALGKEIGSRIADGIKSALHDISVSISIADTGADAKIRDLTVRLDALGAKDVNPAVGLDDTRIVERLDVISLKLDKIGARDVTPKLGLDDKSFNAKMDAAAAKLKGMGGGPAFLGPALLAVPAAATAGGAGLGAAAGLAGAFTAAAGAAAAFGVVAKPVLASALTAEQAVNTAQNNYNATIAAGVPKAQAQARLQAANANAQLTYNAAIAGGAKPAKALAAEHLALAKAQVAYNSATNTGAFNAKAYQAEQLAIGKAYADLSPQQIALSRQLGDMANAWQNLKAAETPVVAGALQPWLKAVTDLTKNLAPIIAAVSPVIRDLGVQFDNLINSPAFKAFRDFIANTGSQALGALGGTLIDFLKAGAELLVKFNPLIEKTVGWIGGLGPAVLKWSESQKTADEITKFMAWFAANGPAVGGFLKSVGAALKALVPGMAAGGIEELKILTGFFNWVAKLPKGISGPIAEVAGALLLMNKLGVFSVGVKFVGFAAGWITKLLGGATVEIGAAGMQTAAGTMTEAAAAMNLAAGNMLKAAGLEDTAAAEMATAGAAAGTGFTGVLAGALPALMGAMALVLAENLSQDLGTKLSDKLNLPHLGANSTVGKAVAMGLNNAAQQVPVIGPALRGIEGLFVHSPAQQAAASTGSQGTGSTAVQNQQAEAYKLTLQGLTSIFTAQAIQVKVAKGALDAYAESVKNGNTTSAASKTAAATLIRDLEDVGVNSAKAQKDVDAYTRAVRDNGAGSTQAAGARRTLNADILTAATNSGKGKADMAAYTTAVKDNGAKTAAAQAARAALIQDLKNAGVDGGTANTIVTQYTQALVFNDLKTAAGHISRAQIIKDLTDAGVNANTARQYADNYTSSLARIPKDERTNLTLSGNGTWSVKQSLSEQNAGTGKQQQAALGGVIPGYTPGVDPYTIRVSGGEGILVPEAVRGLGGAPVINAINKQYAGHRGAGQGFALGGVVAGGAQADQVAATAASNVQSTNSQMVTVMQAQMTAYIKAQQAAAQAAASSSKYTGAYGSGVTQWTADVLKVLKMLGLPASDLGLVLYQMQTESGGNPNAINLTDSNAAAGDPSRGLLQTIMSTFERWRSSSLPNNIYDPMANIYAAVNYAIHGRGIGSGAGQLGSGHGYDSGGWLPPGLSLTHNGTGKPEPVLSGKQWDMISGAVAGGDGTALHSRAMAKKFDRMIHLLEQAPGRTAGGVGEALNGTARGAVQSAYFRTR